MYTMYITMYTTMYTTKYNVYIIVHLVYNIPFLVLLLDTQNPSSQLTVHETDYQQLDNPKPITHILRDIIRPKNKSCKTQGNVFNGAINRIIAGFDKNYQNSILLCEGAN